MMAFEHGVRFLESPTPLVTPVQVDSALAFVLGVAPVHRLKDFSGAIHKPFLISNYGEAVQSLGYSDLWGKQAVSGKGFTLSEFFYSQFRLFAVAPIVAVNVWDPMKGSKPALADGLPIMNKQARLEDPMAILKTVKINNGVTDDDQSYQEYEEGIDYTLSYDGEDLLITVITEGALDSATTLTVDYQVADASGVTKTDIIGGFDPNTNQRTGLDLVDEVFLTYQKNAAFILAPGFTDDPEVVAIFNAKTKAVNSGHFDTIALLDLPSDANNNNYSKIPSVKMQNGYSNSHTFASWPCVGIGDLVFHASTIMAGLFGKTDATKGKGYPYYSASNQPISMTKICLEDGTELPLLDIKQANFLNENGIGTFLNWGGWAGWGNETTAYPQNTDVKDSERSVRRMWNFIKATITRTIWQKVDAPINKVLIDNIQLTVNQWLNSLVAENIIIGGKVEFWQEDNQPITLLAGRVYFRMNVAGSPAAKELVFDITYDPDYLNQLVA